MYAVSFRIPFIVMGKRQYLNGSAHSKDLEFGVVLVSGPHASAVEAEVIDCRRTGRNPDTFEYKIVSR